MQIYNYKDKRPIYEQIVEYFQEMILKGMYITDDQLPSVRNLAVENAINPNTIQRAYAELERRGIIYSVKGRGNFVAPVNRLKETKREELFKRLKELMKEAINLNIESDEFIEQVQVLIHEVYVYDRN